MLEKVCVLSRRSAQAWSPKIPTVAIRISDVGSPPFQLSPAIRETLHLRFDDIASRFDNQVLMTRQQARDVRVFLDRHARLPETKAVLVCCEAGVSRPAAVAQLAVERYHAELLGQKDLGGKPVGAAVDAGAGLAQHAGKGGGLGRGMLDRVVRDQRITNARDSVSPAAKAAHPSGEATSPAASAAQQARQSPQPRPTKEGAGSGVMRHGQVFEQEKQTWRVKAAGC